MQSMLPLPSALPFHPYDNSTSVGLEGRPTKTGRCAFVLLHNTFPFDFINVFQHDACSRSNTIHRLFCNKNRYLQFFTEQLINTMNHCTTTCQDDTTVNNICR